MVTASFGWIAIQVFILYVNYDVSVHQAVKGNEIFTVRRMFEMKELLDLVPALKDLGGTEL